MASPTSGTRPSPLPTETPDGAVSVTAIPVPGIVVPPPTDGGGGGIQLAAIVSGFSPQSGPPGTAVTVSGARFPVGTGTLYFNTTPTGYQAATSGSLQTTVPAGATTGPISVAGGVSAQSFVVTAPPAGFTVSRSVVIDPDPDPAEPVPAAAAQAAELKAGQVLQVQFQAEARDVFNNPVDDVVQVSLSGIPPQSTPSLAPNPVHTFTPITLTLATTLDTPPGDYQLRVDGKSAVGSGITYAPYFIAVKIDPPTRKVFLMVTNLSGSVHAGQTATYAVGIRRKNLPGESVTLAVDASTLPAGTAVALSPNPTTGVAANLVLTPPPSAAPGTYPVTVKGTVRFEGATVVSAASTLVVVPATLPLVACNRLIRSYVDPVKSCRVELRRGSTVLASSTTDASGAATLPLAGISDGACQLVLTPRDSTTDPVGPDLAAAQPQPDRIWRPLTASVTIAGGTVVSGDGVEVSGGRVTARVQPVFMKSPNLRARTGGVTLCVVHETAPTQTGKASVESTLNTFLNPQTANPDLATSSHYVVDRDGQIIKLVHESSAAFHAGFSYWAGKDDVNDFSVGIEQVHDDGPYPAEQLRAVTDLLGRIRAKYPSVKAEAVVGHSDVGTSCRSDAGCPNRRLGRKSGDPGVEFDWKALRDAGLSVQLKNVSLAGIYGGFFDRFPNARLRENDSDATHTYGGTPRPAITAALIRELQGDLLAIGYYCRATGVFDKATVFAVQMFQEHFFSGTIQPAANPGQLDRRTAETVKQARG